MRSAIVVGRSRDALKEYAAACRLCKFDEVLVVGKMGEDFPERIDHWVSFHSELFGKWAAARAARGYAAAGQYWGAEFRGRQREADPRPACLLGRVSYIRCRGGSSGYMGVEIALEKLGAERVVLAGVPMSADAAHHGDLAPWGEADLYWVTWEKNLARLRSCVRSMSGRTRDAFGAPTREWLGVR